MNDPGIDLMEENLMAHKEDTCEHVLDHRVSRRATQMKRVKQLASNKLLILDLVHKGVESQKHLLVDCQSQLQSGNSKCSVS